MVLHEKGGKFNWIPLHHKTIELIGDWLSSVVLWEDKEALFSVPLPDTPQPKQRNYTTAPATRWI